MVKICPRNLENSSHTYAGRSSIEWIAASSCQKNSVHMKCCRTAENRPYVGRIHNIFQYSNTSGVLTDFFYRRQCSAFHGAEHPSCQCITGHFDKCFIFCCVYRDFRITRKDISCLSIQIFMFNQKRKRFVPRFQCTLDHLWALCNKKSWIWLIISKKLHLGCSRINIQFQCSNVVDFNNIFHTIYFLYSSILQLCSFVFLS